jgi:hypothetical protein
MQPKGEAMRGIGVFAALTAFGALILGPAPARAAVTLPAASGFVQCNISTGGLTPAEPSSCDGGLDMGQVTYAPFTGLFATASYPGNEEIVSAGVFGALTYYFEVLGPGPSAPLEIGADLLQTTVGNGYAFAEVVIGLGSEVIGQQAICSDLCPDNGEVFNGTLDFEATTGVVYDLHLEVEAGTAFSEDPNSGTASADPHIFVNPTFPDAADYSIVLSPGVGNAVPTIPEPRTWAMTLIGFAGLGLARYRVLRKTIAAAALRGLVAG